MTDEPTIHSALTPEEWEGAHDEERRRDMLSAAGDGVLKGTESESYHAAAALALYSQPFGFTQADVEAMERASYRYGFCDRTESCSGCDDCNDPYERYLAVIEKVRALLPPDPEALRQQLENDALKQAQEGG